MSGGQLVVLDRLGRDVKCFPLAEGVVTLGSDHSCDIRFMLDSVDPHHATVAVHTNQVSTLHIYLPVILNIYNFKLPLIYIATSN